MTDDAASDPKDDMARADTGWRDEDLKRAMVVAKEAGLASYRIEIAPDGTISIVVGDPVRERE